MALTNNTGPAVVITPNSQAVYSVGGVISSGVTGGTNYGVSVTAVLAASQDNYSPSGYLGGVTNRLVLTPVSGGSTILGLPAATDGFTLLLVNNSTTDNITFAHQSSSNALNNFSCPNGVSAVLVPLSNTLITYVLNQWVFA